VAGQKTLRKPTQGASVIWRSQDQPTRIGWAIGKGETYQDPNYQEQVEAEALYELLEHDVIPTFYDRGPDGVPRRWIEYMKSSIGTICPSSTLTAW